MGCRCYMLRRTPVDVDRRQSRALSSIVSTLKVSAIEIEIHYLQSCLQLCSALTSMYGLILGRVCWFPLKEHEHQGRKVILGDLNQGPISHVTSQFESSARISLGTKRVSSHLQASQNQDQEGCVNGRHTVSAYSDLWDLNTGIKNKMSEQLCP